MGEIENRLAKLGVSLPPAKPPVANYLGCKISGRTLYVSARVSRLQGEVGSDLTVSEGQAAAREAVIDLLAIIKASIGDLDRIESVEKVLGFVRSAPDFEQQPKVLDGASDLLISLWGENGRHARTATASPQLPFGAAVQIEMVMRLRATE